MAPLDQTSLERSVRRQLSVIDGSIVLTPVDSFPIYDANSLGLERLEGLYATDRPRGPDQVMASKIFFAGRGRMSYDMKRVYSAWSAALGASDTSMRLLSGLHAHVTIFMGLGHVGDTILLLPESAGGHFATTGILRRLGYRVEDIPIDIRTRRVDKAALREVVARTGASILFIDRSEGLVYEDFTGFFDDLDIYTVFDASQYLSGILAGLYKSPFDMGFDLLVSTLHKSFPGPQKALVATKCDDAAWARVKSAMSEFVSSHDVRSTYLAGLGLAEGHRLKTYAVRVLRNAVSLENELYSVGVAVERRPPDLPPTQHLWVPLGSREAAYRAFREFERCRLHTNFRLLPYGLGHGLRIGTTGATLQGLMPSMTCELAAIFRGVLDQGFSPTRRRAVRDLARRMAASNDILAWDDDR